MDKTRTLCRYLRVWFSNLEVRQIEVVGKDSKAKEDMADMAVDALARVTSTCCGIKQLLATVHQDRLEKSVISMCCHPSPRGAALTRIGAPSL